MLNTLSFLGLVVAILGAIGAYTRITSSTFGLYLVIGGLAWMALLFLPALQQQMKWRARAGVNFALFFGFLAAAAVGAGGYFWYQNPLNDLTTNTAKPPAFTQPVYRFQPLKGRELLDKSIELNRSYPAEFAGRQNAHYSSFESLQVRMPPVELTAVIETAIKQNFPDWKIVYSDKTNPHLEAEIENPWLHTVDDFVVEAKESKKNPNVSNVDFRVRNRFPYGDLGLSAKRMTDIQNLLAPALRQAEQKWADYQKQYGTKAIPAGGLPGTVSDSAAVPAGKTPGTVSHEISGATSEKKH